MSIVYAWYVAGDFTSILNWYKQIGLVFGSSGSVTPIEMPCVSIVTSRDDRRWRCTVSGTASPPSLPRMIAVAPGKSQMLLNKLNIVGAPSLFIIVLDGGLSCIWYFATLSCIIIPVGRKDKSDTNSFLSFQCMYGLIKALPLIGYGRLVVCGILRRSSSKLVARIWNSES